MSVLDSPATITTLAALGGSIIGALTSTVGAWIGQRHRERRELVAKKIAQLEQLYSDFINESARLLVDAVQHSLESPGMLATLYALLSRIRLSSSTYVIERDSCLRAFGRNLQKGAHPVLSSTNVVARNCSRLHCGVTRWVSLAGPPLRIRAR